MMKTVIATALFSVVVLGAVNAEDNKHEKASKQAAASTNKQIQVAAANADGKRLPMRDCKWYEGVTQSHGWPQYEIGNPGRPECPPAK